MSFGMSGCCRIWQAYVGARRNGRLKMADQNFRGIAVCVDVIGGDDRRPSDPIMVFGVQEMIITRTFLNSGCCFAQDERLGSGDGECKTLLTRQIAFEPLPASVLFAIDWLLMVDSGSGSNVLVYFRL